MANVFVNDASLQAIAGAIREKTGSTAAMKPGEMAAAIQTIETGGGGGGNEPLDPEAVYAATRPADWLPMPTPNDNEMYLLFHIPEGVSSLIAFTVTCTGNYTVQTGTVTNGAFVSQTSTSIETGVKYEAELFASDYGDLTADGFKQVMIKVSGTAVKTWEPSTHSKKTVPSNFAQWNIVEIVCKLSQGTKVSCGNALGRMSLSALKFFSWLGTNAVTYMSYMFQNCYSLTAIPQLDTSRAINMNNVFCNCQSLTAIPQLDTSRASDMSCMFQNCYSLTAIPQLNTIGVNDMSYMFHSCYSLTAIPQLDTGGVTNMGHMFYDCYSLTAIPQLDTSVATNMGYMFYHCQSLTAIPQLNTIGVNDMSYMFYSCPSLTAIPQLNTIRATNMGSMFSNCQSLTAIPQLNTIRATNMGSMFSNCQSLTAIPQLYTGKVTNMNDVFANCCSLATVKLCAYVTGWAGCAISLSGCSLSHDAIVQMFNSLPTITRSKALTLTGNPGVGELTDAEKAIATQKGWTLTL